MKDYFEVTDKEGKAVLLLHMKFSQTLMMPWF